MKKNHNTYPTLHDIRKSQGVRSEYVRYLPIARYILYPIGFLLTWVAIRIGLTTEVVAWLSGIVGIAGCLFLITGIDNLLPIGIGLLLFFNLLDCVDGSIARTTKTENPYGRFLDSICGGIVNMAFWGIIGILAFRHSNLTIIHKPFGYGSIFWLAIGGFTCFLYIFLGYLENTFNNSLRDDWNKIQFSRNKVLKKNKDESNNHFHTAEYKGSNIRYILSMLNTNFRVRETHYLLLIVAYLFQAIDLLIVAYFLYYLFQNIILLIIYSIRGQKIRKKLY